MEKILKVIVFCHFCFFAKAQVNFVSSNLPIISIYTNGKIIGENAKIVADLTIRDNPSKLNKLSDPIVYQGKIGIELRGSTSLGMSLRKPYSIETRENDGSTNKDIALLGMEKENDWALIAPYSDKSLIRDAFLYTLARKMMPWAPDFRFADVFVDDKYEGIYMVTEKIKQGKHRINIDKMEETDIVDDEVSGGYIFAFDKLKSTDKYFKSNYKYPNGSSYPDYIIMSPKADKIVSSQYSYIRNWVRMIEKEIYTTSYSSYSKLLDINSFVDFVILNELSKNVDGYRLSTYFYKDKDSKDNRLHAGPVWDFNLGFGNVNYCGNEITSDWAMDFNQRCGGDSWTINFMWLKLFNDPSFRALLRKRWENLRQNELSDVQLNKTIDNLKSNIGNAQITHFQRYPILNEWIWPNAVVGGSYNEEINYLKNWTKQRTAWLDGAFGKFLVNNDLAFAQKVSIFPNPVSDNLTFEMKGIDDFSDFSLSILDIQGKEIFREQVKSFQNYSISTSSFPEGMYFYQIIQEGKIINNGKFIKIN